MFEKKRKGLQCTAFLRVSGQEQLKPPQSTILIINGTVSWDTVRLKIPKEVYFSMCMLLCLEVAGYKAVTKYTKGDWRYLVERRETRITETVEVCKVIWRARGLRLLKWADEQ